MLKQILSKVSRKQSKSSKNQESLSNLTPNSTSSSSKRSDLGSGNSRKLVNADISSPLDSRFIPGEKNFRNGNPVSVSYEALPSFRDVSSNEKQNLFIKKVAMCSVIFDFTDPTKNLKEKEIKRQTLLELVDFVASSNVKFTESVMQEFVKMVSANLFRELTPQPRDCKILESYDLEEEEPCMDPSWPHLQIVYELLLRFIASPEADAKIAKKYIDHYFVLKLLDMFDSEDPREREYLKTILHRVYGKFMVHRPFIRMVVSNIIYRFVFETEKHNGIAELLEIFGSVISGFALPLKKEHKMFLLRALVPLHKPKSVGVYHHQLTYCVVQFVEKEPKLSSDVIKGLLKFWPVTSSQKQLMFLSELEELLEMIHTDEFEKIMVPLFRRINCCLRSSHFQVAERAHFLWNNEHILHLIMCNRQVIMPLVFSSLEQNSQKHWSRTVVNLAQNMMKMLDDVDHELVVSCQGRMEEDKSTLTVAAERRRLTWERLESVSIMEETATTCVVSC